MVSIEWQDGVALVRLGAEQNMVNGDFVDGINRALDEIEANPDAKALVTAGEGKFYSYGFDLEYIQGLGAEGDAFLNRSRTLMARMMTFGFPTVAALNGHAFGAGAMFALVHDQRVARRDRGWFCFPEVDIGLRLHPFMLAFTRARLGDAVALEALTAGRRYDGEAAVAAGIASSSVADLELIAAAIDHATARAGKNPEMVAQMKRDLYAPVLAAFDASE